MKVQPQRVELFYLKKKVDTWCKYFASNRSLKKKFSSISSTPSIHADYVFIRDIRSVITEPRHTHSCDTAVHQIHDSTNNVVVFWTMTSIHVV